MSQLPPTRRSSAASAATRQCRTRFRIQTEPWDEKDEEAWTGPSEPGQERDSGCEGADEDPEHVEREQADRNDRLDRKCGVVGPSVAVSVDLGGCRIHQKQHT